MSVQKEGQPALTSVGTRSGATAAPAPQVTDSSPMSPVKVSVMCHGGRTRMIPGSVDYG